MIPTYNCAHYLESSLKSVLVQDVGPEDMQIEVVDDCSTKDDPEAVVKDIGGTRVSFFRQPKNYGNSANFISCIQRARGHWVHILHGDDMVLPGFYRRLREAFKTEPTIGAAFCRHIYIEEDDNWRLLSPLERRTPGILSHWLERIAVMSLIQPPSIVVKRQVYEELGGFHPELSVGEDWEM
jgi:glycosyltransferase involved in cell wall biosynthesis